MKLKEFDLPNWEKYQIKQSLLVNNMKILILELLTSEQMEIPKEGVRNLIAIDPNTEDVKWIAKIPAMHGLYGAFDHIYYKDEKLTAWCGSILCEIKPDTGEILSEEFVK